MKVTIDPASPMPILVQEGMELSMYNVLNILDKQSNTVAQIVVEDGVVAVKGDNLFPANSLVAHRPSRQMMRRDDSKPCGCLDGG